MGLPAAHATSQTKFERNDIVIRGYLLSVETGNAAERVAIATKNPLGLIVSTGVKMHGEVSGSSTIEGKAKEIAKEIGEQIRPRFEQQGWIPPQ